LKLFTDFAAIDFETTGLEPETDEIIEFGAARFEDGRMVESFSRLADPGRSIPREVTQLTGITNQDVADQPSSEEVLEEFLVFLEGADVLVAHNAAFEADLLKTRDLREFADRLYDSLALSRIVWPGLNRHDLESLAESIDETNEERHRAEADAIAAGKLWVRLLEDIDRLHPSVVQTVCDLLKPAKSSLRSLFEQIDAQMAKEAMLRQSGPFESILPDFSDDVDAARARAEPEAPGVPQLLDVERMGRLFSERGIFAKRLEGFEYRPQQVEMTRTICEAFNHGEHAVIEAGTGTGKSLAYLTPAIGWASLNEQKVVVSTNTKSLQDQLFEKDIPALKEVLKKPFTAVRLKGAGNYLCPRRLLQTLQNADWDVSDDQRLALASLVVWTSQTKSGDITDCTGFLNAGGRELWTRLGLGSSECMSASCNRRRNCFLLKARGAAMKADLIVVNHALVFSAIGLDNSLLPPYAHVIFDEAQNLENVATENLAKEISSYRLNGLLDRLHHPDSSETGRGILGILLLHLTRTQRKSSEPDPRPQMESAVKEIRQAREKAELFFEAAADLFADRPGRKQSGKSSSAEDRLRYSTDTQSGKAWRGILSQSEWLVNNLNKLLGILNELPHPLSKITTFSAAQRTAAEELPWRIGEFSELIQDLDFVLNAQDTEYVYWATRDRGRRETSHRFQAAPIDIGPLLVENLFRVKDSAIMVSATLAAGRNFDFFKQRTGLDRLDGRPIRELLVGSCFDLENQTALLAPTYLPEPEYRATDFGSKLAEVLIDVFKASNGRGLVLCTSYALLEEIHPLLKRGLEPDSIPVLAQGIDGEAPRLARIFKADNHSVLLGTQSFWEGFDAPGDTLCCVVLSKLPFPVFTDPIVEARCERLESRGLNPFMNYMVPNAGIRLKQGFGRLIRTANDYGAVVLADKRILTKRYGKSLRQALPVELEQYNRPEDLVNRLQQFFGEKDGREP